MSFGANLNGAGAVLADLSRLENRWSGEVKWVVGSSIKYAVHQEFGTSRHKAQPFLRPAANEVMRNADQIADGADSTDELVKRLALAVERKSKIKAPVDTGALRSSLAAERIQ